MRLFNHKSVKDLKLGLLFKKRKYISRILDQDVIETKVALGVLKRVLE